MGYNFRPYHQDESFLLPIDLREWVDEGSLAAFVSDTLDMLELSGRLHPFFEPYRADGWGNKPFHPTMMLKVLLYAYCKGVTSSRRIAELLQCDIHFRFLAANQTPDFRTINLFRLRHIESFSTLFVEVLMLCREAGLTKAGAVALDGHKIAGNAALDQNRTLEQLRVQVESLMTQAHQADLREDLLFGDERGDELPQELRNPQERLERIKAAQARLEEMFAAARSRQEEKISQRVEQEAATGKKKRGRKPKTAEQVQADLLEKEPKANTTDPDSRILKGRHGYVQGYNGQAMADCESQVIRAHDLTQDENDQGQLEPMLYAGIEQSGSVSGQVLVDAGYNSEDNARLEDREEFSQIELYICQQKEWKERKEAAQLQKSVEPTLAVESTQQQVPVQSMPEQELPTQTNIAQMTSEARTSSQTIAAQESTTTTDKTDAVERVRQRMNTPEGKQIYKKRAATIEPVFGQMINRGLTRFHLRGVKKVSGEWSLWCLTHNILKLWRANNVPKGAMSPIT